MSLLKSSKFLLLTVLSAIFITKYLDVNYISCFQSILPPFIYIHFHNLLSTLQNNNPKKVQLNSHLPKIFNQMIQIADQPLKSYKVAVGFGSCVDIFTDAVPLLKHLKINAPKSQPEHFKVISNEKDLSSGFSYFFTKGAASERYVSDTNLFDNLVDHVKVVNPTAKYALGGNAPVMANRFAKELPDRESQQKNQGETNQAQSNPELILAAQHSHEFSSWMDEKVHFTGPETNHADRHLILEYKTGETYDHLESSRANRFIIH